MAKKKTNEDKPKATSNSNAFIENAGKVLEQPITETLEKNYMPYAMSVIVSRAIPEIDGLKPSHRKILYTMYKMGLLTSGRTKSANVVGQTMRLHPHGDMAIYETMVRMSRGYESLLHPYVDSKGNFGKSYSRDMAFAAARYTEVKLHSICAELFGDIDKDTVDFIDNYDGTMKEPMLLPVTFPSILCNPNVGIAVGMASSICSFNLAEVCETTIALLKNSNHEVSDTLKGPDFPIGGQILLDEQELHKIYQTGRGSVKVRSVYHYDSKHNCIEIDQIPPSTTVEAIIDKIVELVKNGKIKEVSDIRDETDLSGLKLTIDLKRGTDADKLMQRLYRLTPLEDSFSCNFNVLIGGTPRVMGVREILDEWIAFRMEAIRRRVFFDLKRNNDKLHLLQGLSQILLDIDKAIRIVRETELEEMVIPNLMDGFGIDEIQAEYVAEIRLRQLNREYILKRTAEIEDLEKKIAELNAILSDPAKQKKIIIAELTAVIKKHGKPRKSVLISAEEIQAEPLIEEVPDYPVVLFFTKEGYFKKVTPQSLRMSGEHKLKDGDYICQQVETTNRANLLFFTDRGEVYKTRAHDFEDGKVSVMGEFIPARLGMEDGEQPLYMAVTSDYKGFMLFCFENGKVAKVDMSAYETKTNRRKLTAAYFNKIPVVGMLYLPEEGEVLLSVSNGRVLLLPTPMLEAKTTRTTQGVVVVTLRGKAKVEIFEKPNFEKLKNPNRFRLKAIPSSGTTPKLGDFSEN